GNLLFGGPVATSVQFGKDVPVHEIDMGEGAFLLSAAYATQLLTPPAQPKIEPTVAASTTSANTQPDLPPLPVYPLPGEGNKTVVHERSALMIPTTPPTKPVAPGRGGQRYRLRLKCKPGDFFEVMKALEKL